MVTEKRRLRCMINKAGGTAGKESLNYRLTIPNRWAVAIGISKESRELAVSFDGKQIVIMKGDEESAGN